MLESVYSNSFKRGGMVNGTKEMDLYQSLVLKCFEFTEKGETAANFIRNYASEGEFNPEDIPKPKIVKGMPPAF